jgi:serine/threonine protein kinase
MTDHPPRAPQEMEAEQAEWLAQEFAGFRESGMIHDAGEIELGAFIADGTTGGVYKGMWQGMVCAVKRFRYSHDDSSLVQTFKNEVFLLRNLSHENLVTFYGACAKPPNLCILTELMTGSLSSLLYGKQSLHADGRRRELSEKRQATIVKGVCTGMAFLHSHSVAHRDLKSANVLCERAVSIVCTAVLTEKIPVSRLFLSRDIEGGNGAADDRNLNIKICDFAFSKFKQRLSALMESQVGTPAWMAPEVLRGEEYGPAADVYSMGVIIWEVRRRPLRAFRRPL